MNEIDCRRTQVLCYFGEAFPAEKCQGTCDNCRKGTRRVSWEDMSEQGKGIIRVVNGLTDAKLPKLTLNNLRALLCSKEKKLDRARAALEKLGISLDVKDSNGKLVTRTVCEKILQGMVIEDYLREDSAVSSICVVMILSGHCKQLHC
jgi:superfamily II DNA helicase RecQ